MELPDRAEAESWQGRDVVDKDGSSLGRCQGVFADTDTGLPEWVLVDVDGRRAFVPAGDAGQDGDRVQVRFSRDQILAAPDVGDVAQLTEQDEQQLYTHYGVAFSTSESGSVLPVGAAPESTVDAAPEPTVDAAPEPTVDAAPESTVDAAPEPTVDAAPEPTTRPAGTSTKVSAGPSTPTPPPAAPAAWAPRAVPPSGDGSAGSSAAPLAALAGLMAAVWLGLRQRDRRAAKRRALTARTGGLRRQLVAGSSVLNELAQQAAELTQQAASSAAASTADATRTGRSASRAARRSAARAAARRSASTSRQAARQRKQLARQAAAAGSAVTGGGRQLAQAATTAASAAGSAVTGSTRQLAHAATATGSAVTDSGRQLAGTVASVPVRAARRGRKARRSVGRVLWDGVLATAAGAGYVAGARAGRERYDEIAGLASWTAQQPEVRRVAETVTTTVADPERRAEVTGALLQKVRPQND